MAYDCAPSCSSSSSRSALVNGIFFNFRVAGFRWLEILWTIKSYNVHQIGNLTLKIGRGGTVNHSRNLPFFFTLSPLKQIAVSARRDPRYVDEICLGIFFVFGSKLAFYP